MVLVDRSDSVMQPVVDHHEPFLLRERIARLVQGVVTSDPLVSFVVNSELFPEPDEAVLEILVPPEAAVVNPSVGVPSSTLSPWGGVNVNDSVDGVLRADSYGAVEVFEAFSLEDPGVIVVCGNTLGGALD
jgi:hypothetical protein